MKILIDTNIYLDFYRSNNDSLKILSKIQNESNSIILTNQIIDEFYRSREKVLKLVKNIFLSESNIERTSSTFLPTLTEYNDFSENQKKYLESRKYMEYKIQDIIDNISSDTIATEFKIFTDKIIEEGNLLTRTEEIYNKAIKRKYEGNPPTSDKYSIGDEINWEIVLANLKDDIVIVGRDSTYTENFNFLRQEYHRETGKFIIKLTNTISEAFKIIGIDSSEIKSIEAKQIEDLNTYAKYWHHKEIENEKEN
jgi:predicted nucleic acid-binding protein